MTRALSIVGHDVRGGRDSLDFYLTPPYATQALIDREEFIGPIWEPACGDGAMVKVLRQLGPTNPVYFSDIIYRGFEEHPTLDFLLSGPLGAANVITNPPFNEAENFIRKALRVVDPGFKACFLLKLTFLESEQRQKFFRELPPRRVLVFSKRLTMTRNGEPLKSGGMICFAWFVWERGYAGQTVLDWI